MKIKVKQVWEYEIKKTTPLKLLLALDRAYRRGGGIFEVINEGGVAKIRRTK